MNKNLLGNKTTIEPPAPQQEVMSPVAFRASMANNVLLTRSLIASAITNIVLVVAFIANLIIKDTVVKVVEFVDGSHNFVRVIEPGADVKGDQLLVDYFVRKYVHDRETVDQVTEAIRGPYIRSVSNDKVWASLKMMFNDPRSPHNRKDFKREVSITRVSYLTPKMRQVEFKTLDTYDKGVSNPSEMYWVATISLDFKDRKQVNEDELLANPLGLLVTEYSIVTRKEI